MRHESMQQPLSGVECVVCVRQTKEFLTFIWLMCTLECARCACVWVCACLSATQLVIYVLATYGQMENVNVKTNNALDMVLFRAYAVAEATTWIYCSIWRESATISWILDKAKATKINCEITLEMMSPESCCCSQVGHCPCPKNWVSFGTRSWALCARALAYWLPAESQLVEDLCRTRPLFVWAHRLHSALALVVAVISSPHVEIRNRLWSATSDWACSWYEWFPTPFPL